MHQGRRWGGPNRGEFHMERLLTFTFNVVARVAPFSRVAIAISEAICRERFFKRHPYLRGRRGSGERHYFLRD